MAAQPKHEWTPEAYLAFERSSPLKHEYMHGEVYNMGGASEAHNIINLNIAASLHTQVRKRGCRAYANEMRVEVKHGAAFVYPDVVVVCGKPQIKDDGHLDILLNPTVVFEVLSPSTELYDRSEKFAAYRSIESLQEYILISQTTPRLEQFRRGEDGLWIMAVVEGLEARLELPSIGCALTLTEVYEDVTF